jgi:hypothetical protein
MPGGPRTCDFVVVTSFEGSSDLRTARPTFGIRCPPVTVVVRVASVTCGPSAAQAEDAVPPPSASYQERTRTS